MPRKELPAQAANIKRAVASTTTCTSATVDSLKSFLLPERINVLQQKKPAIIVQTKEKLKPAAQVTKGPKSRARKAPWVTVLEVPQEETGSIKPQERFTLATEIVNETLKALTDAIKRPPQKPAAKKKPSLSQSISVSSFNNGSEIETQLPLQPRSVNRISSAPGESCRSRCSSSTNLSKDGPGLLAQAECARIAFAALRSIQAQKSLGLEMPYLQLETGMSALVGKLSALGLEELAVKELRILKRRLEVHAVPAPARGAVTVIAQKLGLDEEQPAPKKETLAGLLSFQSKDTSGTILELIVTSQLQALKLIVSKADTQTTAAAFEHLQLCVPGSPANLIQKQVNPELPMSRLKAARQLESLSQSLLSLCPNISHAEDERASQSQKSICPFDALQFQLLAFELRSIWWKMAGHRGDTTKDILEPFTRCLASFRRRSALGRGEKYNIARVAHKSLLAYTSNTESTRLSSSDFQQKALGALHQLMADMAQESLQHHEAIEWLKQPMNFFASEASSGSRVCALACRIATLRIRASVEHSEDQYLLPALHDAAKHLEGDLKSDSADLDELLVAVASLRRASFSVLHDTYRPLQVDKIHWSASVVGQCSNLLLLGVRFVVRYIGRNPGPSATDRMVSRYHQRQKLASEISNPFVDSIVALARFSIGCSQEEWKHLDTALQDCLSLVSSLEELQSKEVQDCSKFSSKSSPVVAISGAYWFRYLFLKQNAMDSRDSKRTLLMSIDVVRNRNPSEQIAGLLPTKFEQHGKLYEACGEYEKAIDAYSKALRVQIDAGCLQVASDAAATTSVSGILGNNGEQSLLGRLLLAYARAAIKLDDASTNLPMIFDDQTLPSTERGVLLEQQLSAMTSILHGQGLSARLSLRLQNLATLIMSIYTNTQFPVRRLRVLSSLFTIQSSHSKIFPHGFLDQSCNEEFEVALSSPLSCDVGLERFVAHLKHSRTISLSICQEVPGLEAIKGTLKAWSELLCDHLDWASLQTVVGHVPDWLVQLESLGEYLEMRGLDLIRLPVLNILASLHEKGISKQCSALVEKLSALGLHYVRLGYSGKAGLVLDKAQRYVEASGVSSEVVVKWHLACVEYALGIDNTIKSEQHLTKAYEQYHEEAQSKSVQNWTIERRVRMSQMFADIAHVQSLLAAAKGHYSQSLLYARQSVKLNHRAWAILERPRTEAINLGVPKPSAKDFDTLSDSMSEISISKPKAAQTLSTTYAALGGAAFWSLVPRLFHSVQHLSEVFAHGGLFPEARYYSEQGMKIADAVHASNFKSQSLGLLSNHLVRSGDFEEGASLIDQAGNAASLQRDQYFATLYMYLASKHLSQGDWRSAETACIIAQETVEKLTSTHFVDGLIYEAPIRKDLDVQMSELVLEECVPSQRRQTKPRLPATRPVSKPIKVTTAKDLGSKRACASEMSQLFRMKCELLRQRAFIAMSSNNLEMASGHLIDAVTELGVSRDTVAQGTLSSRLCHRQALEKMAADPVFGVLPESTVALPSTNSVGNIQDRSPKSSVSITPPRKLQTKAVVKRTKQMYSPPNDDFVDLLRKAHDGLNAIYVRARTTDSTTAVHSVTDIMAKTLLMLSATTPCRTKNSASPTFVVYVTELGKLVSMLRERLAIRVERYLSGPQDQLDWPTAEIFEKQEALSVYGSLDFAQFQTEYIDIIPTSWKVVSMSLSESRDEIRISKLCSGQAPFILTLPLNRQNSRDADEEVFGFDQGKAELRDIITLANESTHNAHDMSRKGAKSEWWEARAVLDARLKDLLTNIESIWLGGFRGIFSQELQSPDLLSRFQQSLHNILNKYLPSRQKTGKNSKVNRTTLDFRVLELFVGVGDPGDGEDLDEPLMDLLYFVVDILQFNGERNAYDEIDFDSIAIETLDALRHYHEAAKDRASADTGQHTILILDKALHCFPWETLPCMSGHAISRLPSIGCLRDRILQQQKQQQQEGTPPAHEGLHIDRQNGAYVLNPSGDLTATESTFSVPLASALPTWSPHSIIHRDPTESELHSILATRSLFLYFGHGSGSQYIRARAIKKLDSCAVALLIGCSSGALTEAGEFEPYGTPMTYMQAGCPALVATLWDVTDKDVDRFSMKVLEAWGLLGQEAPVVGVAKKGGPKAKGKGKAKVTETVEPTGTKMSLDQAVARGRDSCILKYLNGAAPVVYGVPVFLA